MKLPSRRTRRWFLRLLPGIPGVTLLSPDRASAADDKVKIEVGSANFTGVVNGQSIVKFGNNSMLTVRGKVEWKLPLTDIKIDGITVPKFTAGWVLHGLASGVLSSIGGAVFNALLQGLFGGPSMAQLLQEQLVKIEKIVTDVMRRELKNHALHTAMARFKAMNRLMAEYGRAPENVARLNDATSESSFVLSALQAYEFDAYVAAMSVASLRIAVLQEQAMLNKKEKANVVALIEEMKAFHAAIEKYIDEQCAPQKPGDKVEPADKEKVDEKGMPNELAVHLNVPAAEIPRVSTGSAQFKAILACAEKTIEASKQRWFAANNVLKPQFGGHPAEYYQFIHTKYETNEFVKKLASQAGDSKSDTVHPWVIDFSALKTKVKNDTVLIGADAIKKWEAAVAKMA